MKAIYLILLGTLFSASLFAQSNWRQVNSGTSAVISGIQFQDSLIGYASAGNQILKTTDAGENWLSFYQDTSLNSFGSLAIYEDSLFVIGFDKTTLDKRIYLIDLASKLNRTITNASILSNIIRKISSVNNAIWLQSDSEGLVEYKNGVFASKSVDSKYFSGRNNNVIVASDDKVYTSVNSGQTWDTLSIPFYSEAISDSYYNGGDTLILSYGSFPSFIISSFDKGINWFYPNNISPLSSLFYLNSKVLFGVKQYRVDGIVYTSTDAGVNYTLDTLINNNKFAGVYHFSSNLAFVYGENGVIFKTTNLGGLVGLNDKNLFKANSIKLYPNPTQDFLQINISEELQKGVQIMKVLNTKGELIQSFSGYQNQLDVNSYPKGMYLLQIQTIKGTASKSFMVK